uniref:hypothetical protein n=1 Tax=Altererythrobacter segetis TaxID=1104773 RepID=UPI00140DB4F1|nr:hypothetical protein [Altererythrobacter segetis]
MKPAVPVVLALALAGCVTPVASSPLGGSWGGRGVGLTLDAGGGRLEYDCAAGTIEGPVLPDAAGRFVAGGAHSPGHGGPERIDRPPESLPARYSGTVHGGEMRLEVDVPSRGLHLGPFTLRRGAQPVLLRCL